MVHMIGICGPKGSGKSTISKILWDLAAFHRHRFAGPLKDGLKVAFGLTDDHVDGHLKELPTELLNGRTPRHAMITFGTEWGREMIHPDIWLTAWRNTMPGHNRIVVDDVRFPNEIAMLRRDYGAFILKVTRPGKEYDTSHESEAHSELDFDLEIENDGSVEGLSINMAHHWLEDIRPKVCGDE